MQIPEVGNRTVVPSRRPSCSLAHDRGLSRSGERRNSLIVFDTIYIVAVSRIHNYDASPEVRDLTSGNYLRENVTRFPAKIGGTR